MKTQLTMALVLLVGVMTGTLMAAGVVVTQQGAKGDGVTLNTVALQAAIDQVSSSVACGPTGTMVLLGRLNSPTSQ